MGVWKIVTCFTVALASLAGGCQQTTHVEHRRLIEHQALIDFSGLRPVEAIDNVRVRGAIPRNWERITPHSNALFTHQQWKSPSTKTGIGVAHIRMPLPFSTKALVWFAKREYTKRATDGRLISEWTDDLGRPWFEAENDKYRIRGYAVVNGFQAWIIYFGHKAKLPLDPAELSLAARAADSIVPNLGGSGGGGGKPAGPIAKN